ncbi:MAG: site-2 protease family protein [Anaerolineae bacterium]|nr:site-2 protease family protein [Anaerolineae bacterium]
MAEFVPSQPAPDDLFWVRELLDGLFEIDDITPGINAGRALRIRGRFLADSSQVFAHLAPKVRARGRTLLFRKEEGQPVIIIAQGVVRPTPNRRWLPLILSVLTVLSVLFAYTFWWGAEAPGWAGFLAGLPRGLAFTASLLGILVCHEFGHYFMARHFGVAVTLPFLIPFPLSPFGTMGAVIRMKDIPPNRRAMLLIGAAGPLSGLIVGIPILLLGLSLSQVEALPPMGGYTMEGNSILYGLLKLLVFGQWLPSGGYDVMIHPVAFAGWAGLMVTSLNLLPAGQLDGGHAATALLGSKARYLTWGVIALCAGLGLLWQGWLLWALLVFLFSRARAQPLDDVTPLSSGARILAIALLVLFVLTFTPLPLRVIPPR